MEAICSSAVLQGSLAAAVSHGGCSAAKGSSSSRALPQFSGLRQKTGTSSPAAVRPIGARSCGALPAVAALGMTINGTARAGSLRFLSTPGQLVESVKAFVIDIDGVVWDGESLMEGVIETLDELRALGKKLAFITSDSTLTRKDYSRKFLELGLYIPQEEIYPSSYGAAAYLKNLNFPTWKKVYVIGEKGLVEEIELEGFTTLGGPEDSGKAIKLTEGSYMSHDEEVGAVVVGFDRNINYYKLQYATLCLRENPDCRFIATNKDSIKDLTGAQEWAGAGAMVSAVQGSSQKEPIVLGQPSPFMLDVIALELGITPSDVCVVGDQLDNDILFGKIAGTKTLLVLSGITTAEELQGYGNSIKPDFYANQFSDLFQGRTSKSGTSKAAPTPRGGLRTARGGRGRGRFVARGTAKATSVVQSKPAFVPEPTYEPTPTPTLIPTPTPTPIPTPTPPPTYEAPAFDYSSYSTDEPIRSSSRSAVGSRGKGLRGRGRGKVVRSSRSTTVEVEVPELEVSSFDSSSFVYEEYKPTESSQQPVVASVRKGGSTRGGRSVRGKGKLRLFSTTTPSPSPSPSKKTTSSSGLRSSRSSRGKSAGGRSMTLSR